MRIATPTEGSFSGVASRKRPGRSAIASIFALYESPDSLFVVLQTTVLLRDTRARISRVVTLGLQ